MFEAPIAEGAQIFLIIVIVIISAIKALSIVDYLKIREKNKGKK